MPAAATAALGWRCAVGQSHYSASDRGKPAAKLFRQIPIGDRTTLVLTYNHPFGWLGSGDPFVSFASPTVVLSFVELRAHIWHGTTYSTPGLRPCLPRSPASHRLLPFAAF